MREERPRRSPAAQRDGQTRSATRQKVGPDPGHDAVHDRGERAACVVWHCCVKGARQYDEQDAEAYELLVGRRVG